MTMVDLQSVLLEADGPLIVVFRDVVDRLWLATAVERTNDGDQYLCIPVSKARLSEYRHGDIDLRSVFMSPEEPMPSSVFLPASGQRTKLELSPLEEVPPDWYPDEG